MFNKNFYPTSPEVIEKMLECFTLSELKRFKILEPSAGKGDILDYIYKKGIREFFYKNGDSNKYEDIEKSNLYCIEIEPELQSILRDKEYRLIDNDFLSHSSERIYNLIIMNPPFDDGASHLLKAIEISENQGTHIRCLLNSETIDNLYSKERKLLKEKLDKFGANIINLGQCFKNSERSTDVNVYLIELFLPNGKSKFSFDFNSDKENMYDVKNFTANQLADSFFAQALVDSYNQVKKVFSEFLTKYDELDYYLSTCSTLSSYQILESLKKDNLESINMDFVKKLRASAWDNVFKNTKVINKLTSKVQKDLSTLQLEQQEVSFNVDNISNLIMALTQNSKKIQLDCIVDSFDKLTKYHKDNREHIEGWKTNLFWKVSKRFILPRAFDTWGGRNFNSVYYDYHFIETITDIEKALCFLKGINYTDIRSFKNSINKYVVFNELQETEFFKFRTYKKATVHFEFKDLNLLKDLNYYASLHRNWLGSMDSYDKRDIDKDDLTNFSNLELLFKESIKNNPLILSESKKVA